MSDSVVRATGRCSAQINRSAAFSGFRHSLIVLSLVFAGEITDMRAAGVWEPLLVKTQTIKTSVEAANMLLRIDDIVSGISKSRAAGGGGPSGPQVDDHDNVDPEQMLAE